MEMPGRDTIFKNAYRYGFNGKEMDNETYGGQGNEYNYGFRIYNPRIGRFLSVDPITQQYPELTPYQFASNSPIFGIDRDGLELFGNNWLFDIWIRWKFGDPTGLKTMQSGMEEKVVIETKQMSYHNDNVPPQLQNKLDHLNNIDANLKIAAGTSKLTSLSVQTSFNIVSSVIPVGEGIGFIFKGSESGAIDIALGMRNGTQLPEFAQSVKALHVDEWGTRALYNKEVPSFEEAFKQVTEKVLNTGGKVKFDITGLDLKRAANAAGKSLYDEGVGYTDWEFNQVTGNSKLLKRTEFYENGKLVKTQDVLKKAGLKK